MRSAWAATLLALVSCTSGSQSSEAPVSSSAATGSPAPDKAAVANSPASTASPSSAAAAVSAANASAAAGSSSASATLPVEPAPDVEVKNIGMHIGGGPNDAETKGPIKRSVAPHFDALSRCFAKADDTTKGGDVSIDLKIEAKGGKAEQRKYRSGIEGEAFKTCVQSIFDTIDFEKPKTGATVVSYSLRFTPSKKK